MPYLLGFAGVLLVSGIMGRTGVHCLNRLGGRGIEDLYVTGMVRLLAKDVAFFASNFTGSLAKRALSLASRFEPFTGTLVFNIVDGLVPLVFASMVPWRCNPRPIAGLAGMIRLVTYLLGTNVLLETRKRQPAAEVTSWIAAAPAERLHVSVLTLGEIERDISGIRGGGDHELAADLERWLREAELGFTDRVLPVTLPVASAWDGSSTRSLSVS